jgi:hypothetical protein
MENWQVYRLLRRASWENIARRKWRLVNWAVGETATGFKERKKHFGWSALTQPAWVEETNWLAKKTVTARTLILPAKRLPCSFRYGGLTSTMSFIRRSWPLLRNGDFSLKWIAGLQQRLWILILPHDTQSSYLRVPRHPPEASQIATAKTSVNAGRH